jgi:hypothetical protein
MGHAALLVMSGDTSHVLAGSAITFTPEEIAG